MMHIVLLVLKGAGLFLGGLAVFLLALLLMVLFVPVRYRVSAVYGEKERDAKVRISWLLHLLSLEAVYAGEGFKIRLRLLGIGLGRRGQKEEKGPRKKKRRLRGKKKKPREKKAGADVRDVRGEAAPVRGRGAEEREEKQQGIFTEAGAHKEREARKGDEAPEGRKKQTRGGQDAFEGQAAGDQEGAGERKAAGWGEPAGGPDKKAEAAGLFGRIRSFFGRLRSLGDKIRFSFRRICDKLRDIRGLAGQAAQWLGDESNKAALGFLAGQAKKLALHALPRKGGGRLTFGFEDPYTTGQVLAAAAPFYPIYSSRIELCPVFDKKVLLGELDVKGRLRLFTLLRLLFQVYRNKDAWGLVGGLLRR